MTSLWLDRSGLPDSAPEGVLPNPTAEADVVVVGGGITGLVVASLALDAGRSVVVLESRRLGAGATGNTTGKVSLLQGAVLQQLRRHQSTQVLQAYVTANRVAQEWLLTFLRARAVAYQERTAISYATTAAGALAVERELRACRAAGLTVSETEPGLPFPVRAAIQLPSQYQLDPMDLVAALADDIRSRGGAVVESVRVEGADLTRPGRLHTSVGPVRGRTVVLATATPILDRGGYFARLEAQRSYALSVRVSPESIPDGMFLSLDSDTRSIRDTPDPAGPLLILGGAGHPVGRTESPADRLAELTGWTQRYWPGAELTHSWSAQDYRSVDRVPFLGPMPGTGGVIQVATGYNKWGMTNSVAAALAIVGALSGASPEWARTLSRRRFGPRDVVSGLSANAAVARHLCTDWATALATACAPEAPAEGTGRVCRQGMTVQACSTVDGVTRTVSGVCPHLGGVLTWNDLEKSWDCPLHGSRFTGAGTLIEGPATSDLKPLDQ